MAGKAAIFSRKFDKKGELLEVKLSDYIIEFFVKQGVRHCFGISGGAVIHICDSAAKNPNMKIIFTQHEQGAGAAADMYSRITGNLGLSLVTSGPGATNLVTSVCNAYFDSIPCVFISGQVATFRLKTTTSLRQRGFQETDVVSIFSSITKYSAMVRKAEDIRYELEKAVYISQEGRPGPVLLDIPDDLQRAEINPKLIRSFNPPKDISIATPTHGMSKDQFKKLEYLIANAKRPIIIAGAGIRQSKTQVMLKNFIEHYNLPALFTWGALDLFPRDYKFNLGGLGVVGPRSGNFVAQNSDLVIALGTRLSQMITGGKQELFAPKAKKVMVDIDGEEIAKFGKETFNLDLAIQTSLRDFFKKQVEWCSAHQADPWKNWRESATKWEAEFPICLTEYDFVENGQVNAYVFMRELSRQLSENEIIITDAGGNLCWTMQGIRAKAGQRILSAWNHSPMGYSLPAAIGAAAASRNNVVCIIGDGGIMMCLSELGTIRRHGWPIKIFVFNNKGHGIQKQTIETWLGSRYVGVDEKTGLYFPDYKAIAKSFQTEYFLIKNHKDLKKLKELLHLKEPVLIDVHISENQRINPMLKFGSGIEDLDPKINSSKLKEIML